jgi:carbon starvation protein
MIFMLVVPAWAMLSDLPKWLDAENPNWVVIVVGISTLVLEAWMLIEAVILWPKVKGVVEAMAPASAANTSGPNC